MSGGSEDKDSVNGQPNIGLDESWGANLKRLFDEYMGVSLESTQRNRTFVDKVLTDAQQYDNQRQAVANLALENAVDTANLVNKQAVQHRDLAVNKQWNLEPSEAAAESSVLPATAIAAIAAAIADAVLARLGQTPQPAE